MPKPDTPKKRKTSIYLDSDILDALKHISDRTMIPQANLIRLGIKKIIQEYSAKLKK